MMVIFLLELMVSAMMKFRPVSAEIHITTSESSAWLKSMLTRTLEGGLEGFHGSTKLGFICPASGAICSTVTTGGPAGAAGLAGATLRGAAGAAGAAPPPGAAAGAAAAGAAGAGAGGCGRLTRESRPAFAPEVGGGGEGAALCAAASGATSMRSERVATAEMEMLRFTIRGPWRAGVECGLAGATTARRCRFHAIFMPYHGTGDRSSSQTLEPTILATDEPIVPIWHKPPPPLATLCQAGTTTGWRRSAALLCRDAEP